MSSKGKQGAGSESKGDKGSQQKPRFAEKRFTGAIPELPVFDYSSDRTVAAKFHSSRKLMGEYVS